MDEGKLTKEARTKYAEAAEVLNKIINTTEKDKKWGKHFEIAAHDLAEHMEKALYSAAACELSNVFDLEQFMVDMFGMEDGLGRLKQFQLQRDFTHAMWEVIESIPNILIDNCGCKNK